MAWFVGEYVFEGRAQLYPLPVQCRTTKEAAEEFDKVVSPPERIFKEMKSYRYGSLPKGQSDTQRA